MRKSFNFYNVSLILIVVNIIMFIFQAMLGDSFTHALMLVPSDVLIRPWTLLTSMFLHGSVGHLFFNMYALLIFGGLVEQRIGSKRFLGIYLVAGLVAGLVYSLFFPNPALGASGAVMAVLGLTIMLMPHLQVLFFFIIPMSLRTAGFIFVAIDVFGLIVPGSGIAHLAHLGGLACGLLYGYYLLSKKKSFSKKFSSDSTKKFNISKNILKKETIELSDEDIEEYIKNGRL